MRCHDGYPCNQPAQNCRAPKFPRELLLESSSGDFRFPRELLLQSSSGDFRFLQHETTIKNVTQSPGQGWSSTLRRDFTCIGVKFEVTSKGNCQEWVGNITRQLTPSKMSPRLVGDCFGVRLLILHFKFQFSKSIMKSSTYHTFLNLTYPLRRNISFPKCPKITQKFTQNRKTFVYVLNRGIWRCLKRERDIGTKAMMSDVKTAFR